MTNEEEKNLLLDYLSKMHSLLGEVVDLRKRVPDNIMSNPKIQKDIRATSVNSLKVAFGAVLDIMNNNLEKENYDLLRYNLNGFIAEIHFILDHFVSVMHRRYIPEEKINVLEKIKEILKQHEIDIDNEIAQKLKPFLKTSMKDFLPKFKEVSNHYEVDDKIIQSLIEFTHDRNSLHGRYMDLDGKYRQLSFSKILEQLKAVINFLEVIFLRLKKDNNIIMDPTVDAYFESVIEEFNPSSNNNKQLNFDKKYFDKGAKFVVGVSVYPAIDVILGQSPQDINEPIVMTILEFEKNSALPGWLKKMPAPDKLSNKQLRTCLQIINEYSNQYYNVYCKITSHIFKKDELITEELLSKTVQKNVPLMEDTVVLLDGQYKTAHKGCRSFKNGNTQSHILQIAQLYAKAKSQLIQESFDIDQQTQKVDANL